MSEKQTYHHDEYTMRLANINDVEKYYEGNFDSVHEDVIRFTGGKKHYQFEEIEAYFMNNIQDSTRVDFIVGNKEGKIIAEAVLNDIDQEVKSANFRIAIFNPKQSGKGMGSWMIKNTLSYGFEVLNLNRIYLDVFSYNERAIHVYKKMGFKVEGILREAILDNNKYADDILMAMLKKEWEEGQK